MTTEPITLPDAAVQNMSPTAASHLPSHLGGGIPSNLVVNDGIYLAAGSTITLDDGHEYQFATSAWYHFSTAANEYFTDHAGALDIVIYDLMGPGATAGNDVMMGSANDGILGFIVPWGDFVAHRDGHNVVEDIFVQTTQVGSLTLLDWHL